MSKTSANSSNIKISKLNHDSNIWKGTSRKDHFTVEIPAPIINKTTITKEQIIEIASLLDNILQDALVICEEDCCKDQLTKTDINAISRSIVEVITKDLLLPKFDVLEYQKQIRDLQKKLAVAESTKDIHNYTKHNTYSSSSWNEKKDLR